MNENWTSGRAFNVAAAAALLLSPAATPAAVATEAASHWGSPPSGLRSGVQQTAFLKEMQSRLVSMRGLRSVLLASSKAYPPQATPMSESWSCPQAPANPAPMREMQPGLPASSAANATSMGEMRYVSLASSKAYPPQATPMSESWSCPQAPANPAPMREMQPGLPASSAANATSMREMRSVSLASSKAYPPQSTSMRESDAAKGNVITFSHSSPYNVLIEDAVMKPGGPMRCFRVTLAGDGLSCPNVGVVPIKMVGASSRDFKVLGFKANNHVKLNGWACPQWPAIPKVEVAVMVEVSNAGDGRTRVEMWAEIDGVPCGKVCDVADAQFNDGVVPLIQGQKSKVRVHTDASRIDKKLKIPKYPKRFLLSNESVNKFIPGANPPRLQVECDPYGRRRYVILMEEPLKIYARKDGTTTTMDGTEKQRVDTLGGIIQRVVEGGKLTKTADSISFSNGNATLKFVADDRDLIITEYRP